jgi:CBS domain-containing membrane protein
MTTQTPVSEIMTHKVITVDIKSTLRQAEKLMKKHNIRHTPVMDEEELVGILSLNDLLRLSFVDAYGYEEEEAIDTALYQMFTVEEVMVSDPRVVKATQSIREVAEIFLKEDFHALPVMAGEKLVGIVTTTDVIRFMLEQFE